MEVGSSSRGPQTLSEKGLLSISFPTLVSGEAGHSAEETLLKEIADACNSVLKNTKESIKEKLNAQWTALQVSPRKPSSSHPRCSGRAHPNCLGVPSRPYP